MATPLTWNMSGLVWNGAALVWNGDAPNPTTRMPQIVLNLDRYSDTEILALADAISTGLTTHAADFPNPDPTPALITTARTAAGAALTDAELKKDAAKSAFTAKDAAIAAVKVLITSSASWAERKITDPVKLEKVYTLKKTPVPTTSMEQVLGFAVTFGDNAGELDLAWEPVPKARSYEIQCRYTAQPGSPWVHAKISSASSIKLTGLNSAQVIQLRVRAIGPNGLEGPWSDLAEHLVP